jgi:hypothetical protein
MRVLFQRLCRLLEPVMSTDKNHNNIHVCTSFTYSIEVLHTYIQNVVRMYTFTLCAPMFLSYTAAAVRLACCDSGTDLQHCTVLLTACLAPQSPRREPGAGPPFRLQQLVP